ncbi:MAG: hypothetical protein IPM06_20470 [Rhizobiales bacterium]|nr:hypothetical protein [Hyphomicrobiales bacterium]
MITVTLSTPSTLRLSFDYDATVNERLKFIGGAWVSRTWILPVVKLDALIREFDVDLAIHPDVFMVAPESTPAMHFADLLHQAGIELSDVDGRLIGHGGAYCESPWQQLIDARADALRAIMFTKSVSPTSVPVHVPTVTLDDERLTDFDRTAAQFEPAWIAAAQRKQT